MKLTNCTYSISGTGITTLRFVTKKEVEAYHSEEKQLREKYQKLMEERYGPWDGKKQAFVKEG